jgi:hypothetical protein
MLRHAWCVNRRALMVFAGAMIGVPTVAIVSLLVAAAGADRPLLHVWFPAAIGAASGMVVLRTSWRPRPGGEALAGQSGGNEVGPIASTLITAGALIGWFSDLLPIELVGLLNGWALGFFVTFDVTLVSLWRKDVSFRERIKAALAASS